MTKAEVKNVVLAGPKVMAMMLDAKGTQEKAPPPGAMRLARRSLSMKKLPKMPEGLGQPTSERSEHSSRSRPVRTLSRQGHVKLP